MHRPGSQKVKGKGRMVTKTAMLAWLPVSAAAAGMGYARCMIA